MGHDQGCLEERGLQAVSACLKDVGSRGLWILWFVDGRVSGIQQRARIKKVFWFMPGQGQDASELLNLLG